MYTKEQVKSVLAVVQALAEAIRELGSVPSGHLYAMVMSHMSLDDYNHSIAVLRSSGVVRESNHVLTWVGPQPQTTLPES